MPANTIGLWMDEIGTPGEPRWVVSLDGGEPSPMSDTLKTFSQDDYASARASAIRHATKRRLPAVEIGKHGERTAIYSPPGD